MTCDLANPIFTDEAKATEHMEADRWPNGVNCPHCGSLKVHKMAGKTQAGMFLCNDCREKFTVRTGSIFARSHIPLRKWLLATYLMAASKKGMSALQLSRMLALSYESAWFMCHRIRESMKPTSPAPIGGDNKVVEADETFIGGKAKNRAYAKKEPKKHAVMTLVDRDGESRSFHVANVKAKTLRETIVKVASRKSYLATDELASYEKIGKEFSGHGTVNHSADEYVRLGGLHSCQHRRVSFQPYEACGFWHTSFDQRSPFAALSHGMGFQVEHPKYYRWRTCCARPQRC
jgi:transposase-like protein